LSLRFESDPGKVVGENFDVPRLEVVTRRCDVLISGVGTDHMWGDAGYVAQGGTTGADTFVFAPGNGNDDINDFRQSNGDKIDVSAYGFLSMADMMITAFGGNTKIAFDASNSVTLVGISDPTQLQASDFIFA